VGNTDKQIGKFGESDMWFSRHAYKRGGRKRNLFAKYITKQKTNNKNSTEKKRHSTDAFHQSIPSMLETFNT